MKYQVLFSLKNDEKVFINVVCCNESLTNAKAKLLFVFSGLFYILFIAMSADLYVT